MSATLPRFVSPYQQFRERNGQQIDVIRELSEADGYDRECLPAFLARFPDGVELEVLPEEIEGWPPLAAILDRWAAERDSA